MHSPKADTMSLLPVLVFSPKSQARGLFNSSPRSHLDYSRHSWESEVIRQKLSTKSFFWNLLVLLQIFWITGSCFFRDLYLELPVRTFNNQICSAVQITASPYPHFTAIRIPWHLKTRQEINQKVYLTFSSSAEKREDINPHYKVRGQQKIKSTMSKMYCSLITIFFH